jgi:hypothetical protein
MATNLVGIELSLWNRRAASRNAVRIRGGLAVAAIEDARLLAPDQKARRPVITVAKSIFRPPLTLALSPRRVERG